MWQDKHSGLRRHKLMTKELGATIPALYANEKVENTDDVVARAKLFSPYSNWTLVHHRMGCRDRRMLRPRCRGSRTEWGYFDLTELAEATVFGGVPAVERDLYWEPKTIGGDQERVVEGGGLATGSRIHGQRHDTYMRKGEDHARRDRNGSSRARTRRAPTTASSAMTADTPAAPVEEQDSAEEVRTGRARDS